MESDRIRVAAILGRSARAAVAEEPSDKVPARGHTMDHSATVLPTLATETKYYKGHVAMVVCRGRLVAGSEDALYETVRALMPVQKRIILNLAELQYTHSRGLGALVRLYVAGRSEGCSVELMHLSRQIRHLLGLTNLFDVFTVIGGNGVNLM